MTERKLSIENKMIDIPDLNRFRIGDEVVVDPSHENDRFEGTIIGIELRRSVHGGPFEPCLTLLHDDYVTDGFKPSDCRLKNPTPNPKVRGRGTPEYAAAEAAFTEYFVRNYPGPDTIIFDPKWHAPKLFAAAAKAILEAQQND